MNKVVLFLLAIVASLTVEAQINTPAPSPSAKLMQTVGLTEVMIDYSRPNMRGREVYGNLVPFDKLWRTGANAYTKITFDTDVTIGGKEVKAGTYSIFTKPGASNWEVFFYTDIVGGGTPSKWEESKVVASLSVPVYKMDMPVETFTITVDDVMSNGASIGIIWENTYVAVPFTVPTDATVMQSIDKALNGPTADDYYAAASYYLESDKDIKKAQTWIDKSVEMMSDSPKFWVLRRQALIHAKAGDKKGAIKAAKESLRLAEKAGNAGYVKMNTASLKEWGPM